MKVFDTGQVQVARRHFLRSLALGAGATAVGPVARSVLAMEPLHRAGFHFKYSLAAYSYRSLLQGSSATMDLFGFVDDCAKFGLDGTELTSYYFPKDVNEDYLLKLKHHCFRQGLDISGTAVGNDFGHPPGEARSRQIADVQRWIRFAAILDAPVIRIFAGHSKEGATPEQTHEWMVAGIEECCEYAGQHGVHLALENHGGPTATADGLLALVKDVQSPWFGVNLDTGNFHSDDVYQEMAAVAPYALNVQIKVAVTGPDQRKQPTDYGRIAAILKAANYRGYVALEFEEAGDVRQECERHLGQMRRDFAAAEAE